MSEQDKLTQDEADYYRDKINEALNMSRHALNTVKDTETSMRFAVSIFDKIASPLHYLRAPQRQQQKRQPQPQPTTPLYLRTMDAVKEFVKGNPHLHWITYQGEPAITADSLEPEEFDQVKIYLWDNGWAYFSDKVNKVYGFKPRGGQRK